MIYFWPPFTASTQSQLPLAHDTGVTLPVSLTPSRFFDPPMSFPNSKALTSFSANCLLCLEVSSHSFSWLKPAFLSDLFFNTTCLDGGGLVTQSCSTLATPWTIACQASLSMGFPRHTGMRAESHAQEIPDPGSLSQGSLLPHPHPPPRLSLLGSARESLPSLPSSGCLECQLTRQSQGGRYRECRF